MLKNIIKNLIDFNNFRNNLINFIDKLNQNNNLDIFNKKNQNEKDIIDEFNKNYYLEIIIKNEELLNNSNSLLIKNNKLIKDIQELILNHESSEINKNNKRSIIDNINKSKKKRKYHTEKIENILDNDKLLKENNNLKNKSLTIIDKTHTINQKIFDLIKSKYTFTEKVYNIVKNQIYEFDINKGLIFTTQDLIFINFKLSNIYKELTNNNQFKIKECELIKLNTRYI